MKKYFMILIFMFLLIMNTHLFPEWKFSAPMPHGRIGHDAVMGKDGKIYVMGGKAYKVTEGTKKYLGKSAWNLKDWNDGRYSNLCFDPVKKKWSYLKPVPGHIIRSGLRLFNTKTKETIFVKTKDIIKDTSGMLIFKDSNNKKITVKNAPGSKNIYRIYRYDYKRMGGGVRITENKGKIYFSGGMGTMIGKGENTVFPYDISKKSWPEIIKKKSIKRGNSFLDFDIKFPRMSERRAFHDLVSLPDGRMFAFGGWREEKGKNHIIRSVEGYDPVKKEWKYKIILCEKKMYPSAALGKNNKIYIFGGLNGFILDRSAKVRDSFEIYDPDKNRMLIKKMPFKRYSHQVVFGSDGDFYIIGGKMSLTGSPLSTVMIYNPKKDKWYRGPYMNIPRKNFAAVSTENGQIYVIGGSDLGAYYIGKKNKFLKKEYFGKIQETVEVLNIKNIKKTDL